MAYTKPHSSNWPCKNLGVEYNDESDNQCDCSCLYEDRGGGVVSSLINTTLLIDQMNKLLTAALAC